jgi:Zn-finger nucleic acid-binding protein
MTCPKCGAEMRMYERNGVTVDQCTGCRGVFLDRGELERLIDAEGAYYGSPQPQAQPQAPRPDDRYRSDDDYYRAKKKKKPGSFLEDLFG